MLKAEPVVATKIKLETTTTALKPIIISSNDTNSVNMSHQEYSTKQSPSFLKGTYIATVDVNTISVDNSTGGGYRKSPMSCHSAEEESVRSSSSRVRFGS